MIDSNLRHGWKVCQRTVVARCELVLALAIAVWSAVPAAGQESPATLGQATKTREPTALLAELERLRAETERSFADLQMERATTLLDQQLKLLDQLYPRDRYPAGHLEIVSAKQRLGVCQRYLGNISQRFQLAKESLAMVRELHVSDVELLYGLTDTSMAAIHIRDLDTAERLLAEAESLIHSSLSTDQSPQVRSTIAEFYRCRAVHHELRGRRSNAETDYQRAIEIHRLGDVNCYDTIAGEAHIATLTGLINSLSRQHKHSLAISTCTELLDLICQSGATVPEVRLRIEMIRANRLLGTCYERQSNYAEAVNKFQLALDICRLGGSDNRRLVRLEVLECLLSLSGALTIVGRLDESVVLYKQAMNEARSLFPSSEYPEGHQLLNDAIAHYGAVLNTLGDTDTAMQLLLESLRLRQAAVRENGTVENYA